MDIEVVQKVMRGSLEVVALEPGIRKRKGFWNFIQPSI